jgi:hypothetical protein
VQLRDLSLSGARASGGLDTLPGPRPPDDPAVVTLDLAFELYGAAFLLRAEPRRRVVGDDGRVDQGLEFSAGQEDEIARLALAIFQGAAALEVVGDEPRARRRRRAARTTGAAA